MLIKSPDDKSKRLKLLEELQKSDRLDDRQKNWLSDQLRSCSPGIAGERDAAHYLDMSFSESKNHAILHDLRLEAEGQVAQIDHLVVDRTLTFFLLETKSYKGSLHINEHGEFMVEYSDGMRYGIESPLEQSRRHETVLKKVLERVGICGRAGTKPTFVHVVMIHPKGIIHRPDPKAFDTSMVIKADQFSTWHGKYLDKFGAGTLVSGLLNARSRSTVQEWGELLKKEHRPTNPLDLPDFMKPKKVAVVADKAASTSSPESQIKQTTEVSQSVCCVCGKVLSPKVIKYCTDMSKRFEGKLYCYDHQASMKSSRA